MPPQIPLLTASVFLLLALSVPAADSGPPWTRHTIDNSSTGADGVRLADVNQDQLQDIATGWEEGGLVRVYLNPGPQHAHAKWPAVSVGTPRSVEDAVLVDLDNDGALDVVSCSEGKTRTVYVHWAPPPQADYLNPSLWRTHPIPATTNLTCWMFSLPADIDRQNGIDLFVGAKNPNAQIGWLQSPPNPRQLQNWTWHPLRQAGWIMSLLSADMDQDGDFDLLFSDRNGSRSGCFWLEHPADPTQPWPEHSVGALNREVMFLTLTDLDRDGQQDVLAAVKPGQILFLRRRDATGNSWDEHPIALARDKVSTPTHPSCIVPHP